MQSPSSSYRRSKAGRHLSSWMTRSTKNRSEGKRRTAMLFSGLSLANGDTLHQRTAHEGFWLSEQVWPSADAQTSAPGWRALAAPCCHSECAAAHELWGQLFSQKLQRVAITGPLQGNARNWLTALHRILSSRRRQA